MKKRNIGLYMASILSLLGGIGGMNIGNVYQTNTEKYCMGKDTRTPKQRWVKPIFTKGKRTGFLIKFFDNTFQEVSCE